MPARSTACRRSSTSADHPAQPRAASHAKGAPKCAGAGVPVRASRSLYHRGMTASTRLPGRRFLHSPGPTPLPDAVLHAMSVQPMDLADPRVDANIAACEQGVRRLLQSEAADVFFFASNGHGVW